MCLGTGWELCLHCPCAFLQTWATGWPGQGCNNPDRKLGNLHGALRRGIEKAFGPPRAVVTIPDVQGPLRWITPSLTVGQLEGSGQLPPVDRPQGCRKRRANQVNTRLLSTALNSVFSLTTDCPSWSYPRLACLRKCGGAGEWSAPLSTLLTHRAANVGGSVAGSHLLYCRDSRRAVPAEEIPEAHVGLGLSCCNGLHISDMADALGDTLRNSSLAPTFRYSGCFRNGNVPLPSPLSAACPAADTRSLALDHASCLY